VFWQAPIEFNNSKRHRLYGQATGATNVLLGPQHSVADVCREFRVTRLGLSAAQARRLLSSPSGDVRLPPNTEVQLRGSPVSDELRSDILKNMSPKLVVGYGASEIGSITTVAARDFGLHPATLGKPNLGVQLQIVDETGAVLPADAQGAVRVRSEGMATRYHDNPEETARNFRHGWFYPGDIGSIGETGDFRFDGRADDMMVLTSINIFPAEIERVADAVPGVIESAAFAVKSAEFGDIPLLAVVGDGTVREAEVLLKVRNELGVRAPRRVILVDAIPKNAQGKILRAELQRAVTARNNQKAVA
jgi:acyl-coenzyme A synthetase/AMP-(fatty) acid ligase